MAVGCGQDQKIANLEKQNQELKAEVEKSRPTIDYNLQEKCSKDAKNWFNENWQADKNTKLLQFTNHYNKTLNECLILVERHYSVDKNAWTNDTTLWNVYENDKYGSFAANTTTYFKPEFHTETEVITCELSDNKCKNIEEFSALVHPYLNN